MDKWVIITGASTGIGRELVLSFVEQDVKILTISRSLAKLEELKNMFGNITILPLDLSHANTALMVDQMIPRQDKVAYLIHNAATIKPVRPINEISQEEWAYAFNVNFNAPFFITQQLLSKLQGGRVLHISTGLAHYAMAGLAAYCCSKSALYMLYLCLKKELDAFSIAVGSVRPGIVDTPMQHDLRNFSKEDLPDVEDFKAFKRDGRLVSPKKVAACIKWLLAKTSPEEFSEKEWDVREIAELGIND